MNKFKKNLLLGPSEQLTVKYFQDFQLTHHTGSEFCWNIFINVGNIEKKYFTESCSVGLNNKFSLNLFIQSWAGETSPRLEEQIQENLTSYEMGKGCKYKTILVNTIKIYNIHICIVIFHYVEHKKYFVIKNSNLRHILTCQVKIRGTWFQACHAHQLIHVLLL